MRQTFLISVAALALAAASPSGAFAQKHEGAPGASGMNAPAGTNAPSSNPSGANGPSTGAPGAAEHQPSEHPAPGAKKGAENRSHSEKQKSTEQTPSKGEKQQKSTEQTPSRGEQPKQREGQAKTHERTKEGQAEQKSGTKEGQAERKSNMREGENATGSKQGSSQTKTGERAMTSKSVSLTTQQKTEIRSKVLTSSAPRVSKVNFDVRVGTVVPHSVHIVPVPTTLVEIEPEWRGLMYFVYSDEIVIVDPHSLAIVAVVAV